MFFFYQIIFSILIVLSPLIIIYRILKKKEDPKRIKEKFGTPGKQKKGKNLIWFHGASIGEILSIIPIIKKFEKDEKIKKILITSSTTSSSHILSKYKFKKTIHQFFPFDLNIFTKVFINYWKPKLAVFVDSEIWPNMYNNLNKKKNSSNTSKCKNNKKII